jgi:hypothetical protein
MPSRRLFALYVLFLSLPVRAQLLEVCSVAPQLTPGQWTLTCTQPKDAGKAPSFTNTFTLPPVQSQACSTAIPQTTQSAPLDAPTLKTLNPSPAVVITPQGNLVFLVTPAPPTPPAKTPTIPDAKTLKEFNNTVALLFATVPPASGGFSTEIVVPHAAALGSLTTQITGITTTFQLKASGRDRVRVTTVSGLPPSCADWKSFIRDVRELAWSVHPEPPEFRVTQLSAPTTATALSAAPTPAAPAPAASTNAASPAAPAPPAVTVTVAPAAPASTAAVAAPAVPAPVAGATPAAGTTIVAVGTPATPTPPAAAAAPAVSVSSIAPDLLVFADTTPGDDSAITEKKRVAAIMDLPRAEMTISAWVMQNSSTDQRSVTESIRFVREEVRSYNDGLERAILQGWGYLKGQIAAGSNGSTNSYFYMPFYNYVARRVVFDGYRSRWGEPESHQPEQDIHDLLNEDVAKSDSLRRHAGRPYFPASNAREDYLGTCHQDQYCLGYTTLFTPLKPRLTDLLLTLVAAADPRREIECATDAAENDASNLAVCTPPPTLPIPLDRTKPCADDPTSPCVIWPELNGTYKSSRSELPQDDPRAYGLSHGCEQGDYLGTLQSMKITPDQPRMYLNCFRTKALTMLAPGSSADPVSGLGLVRSAVADFLFNYKMSQQYPHEFVPYDLTMSAQAMNTIIRPLVDAFLQDVSAYQAVLKRKLGLKMQQMNKQLTEGSLSDKPRFFNNAIVKVDTIANNEASVDTTTESYLEAINPPS